MFQHKTLAFFIGILFCMFPIVGMSQLQVSVVLPMQMPAELSEWQTNPALVQIIITSLPGTPEFSSARCEFFIRNTGNQNIIASTKPNHPAIPRFPITAGPSTQIRFGRDIIQMMSLNLNREYEANFLATNSLPEGNYEFCLEIFDDKTNQLIYSSTLQGICSQFVVVVPDPPSLILPADSEPIFSNFPVFSWTPVMNADGSIVRYNLKIVPMFEGQNARFALDYNEVLAEIKDIQSTSYLYSPVERPFIHYPQAVGFAWQVQAVTLQGKPATRNNGKSELFTFLLPKDSIITPFTDIEEDETETEPPIYIPNKKRSVQFGEFWVTLSNDIECASCILNVNGYAFLPFLNDSVPVTLTNVPITNIDKPYYVALSGIASNQVQFATKSKNAISLVLSSLKLTPETATLELSATVNWQELGWMSGSNISPIVPVSIQPRGFQQSISLVDSWKREGNQVGLNSLFDVSIDSLNIHLSHSKLDVDGALKVCPAKNVSTSSMVDFECVTTSFQLSDGRASVLIEKNNFPITIKTPVSALTASGFALDLSTSTSLPTNAMDKEWRGVQITNVDGELFVKAPFANAIPISIDAQSVSLTPTSISFVHTGEFRIDSLQCSYGGFPLTCVSGNLNLRNNQTYGDALKGTLSVLHTSKPSNWIELEKIPVEILFHQDLQMNVNLVATQKENEAIATLPLSFEGVSDNIVLLLSKGVINVQSETDATLTIVHPIIKNVTNTSSLPLEPIVFESSSNLIHQQNASNSNSNQNDFTIQGANLAVTKAKFDYTSAKEYSVTMDGFLHGIGKKMPKTLKNVPFEQLHLSTISPIHSKPAPFEFMYQDDLRAFGTARLMLEQMGTKKFLGLKGEAQSSSKGLISFQNQKSTFYIGSLEGKPFWLLTNTEKLLSNDVLLEPQNVERRKEAFSQFVQTTSSTSSSDENIAFGSFTAEKSRFAFGTPENSVDVSDVVSSIYIESSSPVNNNGRVKLAAYIYDKNNIIEKVEGRLQLGQRGAFTLKDAQLLKLATSNQLNFTGVGNIELTSKQSSTAKILIENANNESIFTIKEVSGILSTSSSQNENSLIALTDFTLQNATFVLTPIGLVGVSGITVSSIVGNEGNDPSFIAIQHKPVSTFLLDVFSKESFVSTSNVNGTVITSYNDEPCSQWGTLKGISPQGMLATTGNQTVSSFSVGELSDCGTPLSAYQQGAFSLCYTTMNNQFDCTTPMSINAKNSINTVSFGSCTQCTDFETKIITSKKSLKNRTPKLVALEHIPQKGSNTVDPNNPLRFKYKITNVQKPTEVPSVPYASFEFDTNEKTEFELDSISSNLFSVQNGYVTPVQPEINQPLLPCTEYQFQCAVYVREIATKKSLVFTDTISWKTSSFSKSFIASSDLVYSTTTTTASVAIIDRKTKTSIVAAPKFWQRNKLYVQDLVQKGIVEPQDQLSNSIVMPNRIDQKTEISTKTKDLQCQESMTLSTTAYPPIKGGTINLSQLDNSIVEVQFSDIPAGIEYNVVVSTYCNKKIQQSISKLHYTPTQTQNTSKQQIYLRSIVGSALFNCPKGGYVISVEFPSQFAVESRCLTIGEAPKCSTRKKE